MRMAELRKAWTIARRDLRGRFVGLRLLIVCLLLGVATLAAIGSLTNAITEELANRGQAILGGDLGPARSNQRRTCCPQTGGNAVRDDPDAGDGAVAGWQRHATGGTERCGCCLSPLRQLHFGEGEKGLRPRTTENLCHACACAASFARNGRHDCFWRDQLHHFRNNCRRTRPAQRGPVTRPGGDHLAG